ncbi:MAG TPA: DUF1440 domain-containing protein [Gammaproteobacteria bacterium]
MNKTRQYFIGAFAGTVASLFHTAVMLMLHRVLPRARREPVPPKEIASAVFEKTGKGSAKSGELTVATVAGHFGYGAVTGALYAPIAEFTQHKSIAAGIAYGVGVWTVSYLGWIPAMRLLTPATEQPAQRNVMMILAHIAWGASLAITFEKAKRAQRR